MNNKKQSDNVELIEISKVYESLRYSEYSVENGIGELVDNSVEAGAQNVSVSVTAKQKKVSKKKKPINGVDTICIADDGVGMDKSVLWHALVLGESLRTSSEGRRGIGRFGVGMTLGSISLGRKVEVYSRKKADTPFLYTYIDLDEIAKDDGEKKCISEPIPREIPKVYHDFFTKKAGTLVIVSDCDRVEEDITEVNSTIANYLGRTYRKFIEAGLHIEFNGERVYLHDPLYLSGPTRFDMEENGPDLKAETIDKIVMPLEVPGEEGKTADIIITISLLPRAWRLVKGSGGSAENKLRKVDQNEGISIIRANREVFYDKVPYLIGPKGQAAYEDRDRFWGCEISFPPELDDYFQIRYIKRGAEPVASLRDKLRGVITSAIKTLRQTISSDWAQQDFNDSKKAGMFRKAEQAVEKAESRMPASRKDVYMTEKEEDAVIDKMLSRMSVGEGKDEEEQQRERQERKKQIKEKQLTLNPVEYPASVLFEPKFLLGGKTVININVNHPFYKKFIRPLCGDLEDEDVVLNQNILMMRDAIFLLFCSYARASAMYDLPENEALLEQHLAQMSVFLGAMAGEYT